MDRLTPVLIEQRIDEFLARYSGFELERDYLSISHIADCPRQVVREFKEGFPVEEHTHRMAYAGYEMERNLRAMLLALGIIDESTVHREVVAPFDPRLRGHLDALALTGEIVEIKSVSRAQFAKVLEKGKSLWKHFVQCQLYLRYSGKNKVFLIYRCRETYEHRVIEVPYREKSALEFEARARRILEAIDAGVLLECECGKCGEK